MRPVNSHENARAAIVNRTRRVVRQRAQVLQNQRSKQRDLWLPIGLCSVLLAMVCYAVWAVMEQVEPSLTETTLASEPGGFSSILLLWLLPVSLGGLALVWVQRRNSDGVVR